MNSPRVASFSREGRTFAHDKSSKSGSAIVLETRVMSSKEIMVNTLRAIKNKFWVHPDIVEQCVRKGLARITPFGPELTEHGMLILKTAEAL
jgi:hypothetical protein